MTTRVRSSIYQINKQTKTLKCVQTLSAKRTALLRCLKMEFGFACNSDTDVEQATAFAETLFFQILLVVLVFSKIYSILGLTSNQT